MTTLVLEELQTTLTQEFDWNPAPRAHVTAIRPHLYLHNNPAGTFTMSILDVSNNVVTSQDFTGADVYFSIGTGDPYAHVTFPILLDTQVHLPKGRYKLRLSASGYTFSEASYLAWVRDHEDLKVPLTYTPSSDLANPLSYEIWVNK